MKRIVLSFFVGIIAFSGCNDSVTETVTFMINEPVFMSESDFRKSVVVSSEPQPICNYGKMCFYEGYIYISESGEGIHIINNSNPSSPKNTGFIELLGNADLAIHNGKLYADALIDLVWFDISHPEKPELKGRLENVFSKQMPLPPTGNAFGIDYQQCNSMFGVNGVIVGWEAKQRTESYTEIRKWGWGFDKNSFEMAYTNGASSSNGNSSSVGVNGSMSRFALYEDYLYSVINNVMNIIDLSGAEPVKAADDIVVGNNVETIFRYKDNMFMGTPIGMLIYSVANPLKPEYIKLVWHVFGCDPVVVEDDIAYVTVHSGNMCGQNNNDLIIYDVSDVRDPKHIVSYAMKHPKGLGIDNGTLFLCDDGLKIYNAENPQTLMANRLAHYAGMDGFDVIPLKNILMMIADDGLYQYDYSDLTKIRQLSKLPISKK